MFRAHSVFQTPQISATEINNKHEVKHSYHCVHLHELFYNYLSKLGITNTITKLLTA